MRADPTLVITDRALARLATHAAEHTPGVRRLHASPLLAARRAVRRTGARFVRPPRADVPPVDVDRGDGRCEVTVRITAHAATPVVAVAAAVQERVGTALAALAGVEAVVLVQVLDLEG